MSATAAPASANARATPPVMPVPPPVTNATRPFRTPSVKIVWLIVLGSTHRVDRFFQFEFSFVQGFANDNTIKPCVVHVAQAFYIVEAGNSTRGSHADVCSANHSQCLLNVWSNESAVAGDVSINDSFDAAFSNRSSKVHRVGRRRRFPPPRHHVS